MLLLLEDGVMTSFEPREYGFLTFSKLGDIFNDPRPSQIGLPQDNLIDGLSDRLTKDALIIPTR